MQNDTCTHLCDLRKEYDAHDNNSKLSPTKVSKYERTPSVIQPIPVKSGR